MPFLLFLTLRALIDLFLSQAQNQIGSEPRLLRQSLNKIGQSQTLSTLNIYISFNLVQQDRTWKLLNRKNTDASVPLSMAYLFNCSCRKNWLLGR